MTPAAGLVAARRDLPDLPALVRRRGRRRRRRPRGHRRAARPPSRRSAVEAVWLSPIFPLPDGRLRLRRRRLLRRRPACSARSPTSTRWSPTCHARGIRVVLDWVPNHTLGPAPVVRRASRSSRDDPKRDWYVWRDGAPDGGPPNDWKSAFARRRPGVDLRRGDRPVVPALVHGRAARPQLGQPGGRGGDARRAALLARPRRRRLPDRRDSSASPRTRCCGPERGRRAPPRRGLGARSHERLRGIRRVVDEYEDRMIVGEVALHDLHRVVELPAAAATSSTSRTTSSSSSWTGTPRRSAPRSTTSRRSPTGHAWPAWFLGNHDLPRVASRFDAPAGSGPRGRGRRCSCSTRCAARRSSSRARSSACPTPRSRADRVVDVDGRDPERAPIPWRAAVGGRAGRGLHDRRAVAAARRRRGGAVRRAPGRRPGRSTLASCGGWPRCARAAPALQTGSQRVGRPRRRRARLAARGRRRPPARGVNFAPEPVAIDAAGALVLSTDPDRAAGDVRELAAGEAVIVAA